MLLAPVGLFLMFSAPYKRLGLSYKRLCLSAVLTRSAGMIFLRAARRSLLADYLLSLAVFPHLPPFCFAACGKLGLPCLRLNASRTPAAQPFAARSRGLAPVRTAPPFYGRAGFRASADVAPFIVPKVFFIYRLRIKNKKDIKKCGSADTLDF